MFDLIKRYRLLIFVFLILLSSLIFLFQTGRYQKGSQFESITQTITYPFQLAVHEVVSYIQGIADSYFYLVELNEENKELRQQIASLNEELDYYVEESIQYHRLKVQLDFAKQNPGRKVFTEVIGESIDNFHKTIQLDRGSDDGIRRNFAVILKEGVVGKIQSVSPLKSTVQLIVDRRTRFPAILQRTRAKGLIYGTHDGLELRRINLRADIKVGDRVVANGLSGLYPKGMMIGVVESIHHEDYELFQVAKLTPVVNFDKVEAAFVILKDPTILQKPLEDP